jgi:hypothetical protein
MINEYELAKQAKLALETVENEASKALVAVIGVGSGPMGLTPDAIKAKPEYQAAKKAFNDSFNALRKFNGWFNYRFRKQLSKERKKRDAERSIALSLK